MKRTASSHNGGCTVSSRRVRVTVSPEGDAGGRPERTRREADRRAPADPSHRLHPASARAHVHEVSAETPAVDLEIDVEQQGPAGRARVFIPGGGRLPAREAAGGRGQLAGVHGRGQIGGRLRK